MQTLYVGSLLALYHQAVRFNPETQTCPTTAGEFHLRVAAFPPLTFVISKVSRKLSRIPQPPPPEIRISSAAAATEH